MKTVLIVPEERISEIVGKKYDGKAFFNGVKDDDGDTIITMSQRDACDHNLNPEIHSWMCDPDNPLAEKEHNPIKYEG